MSLLKTSVVLCCIIALIGCGSAEPVQKGPPPANSEKSDDKNSDSKADADPVANSNSKPESFIVDVRSKKEWDTGHVESSINIPHTEIVEGIAKLTTDKNAKIFVY